MIQTNYKTMLKQAEGLTEDVNHKIANFANLSALLFTTLKDINWAGFYFFEGDTLILGPFQGKVACVEIANGRGVCGTAAITDTTQLIPDVHKFPGHIACDAASRSEIVVPLHMDGKVIGVLDIDSASPDRFSEEDKEGLEELGRMIDSWYKNWQ
ncbi:MAG: GAF domain-containing protein [Lachnospiraceae bacterium]|nr:GAF domain-containing protein [Lachnospiraceae bacterium]